MDWSWRSAGPLLDGRIRQIAAPSLGTFRQNHAMQLKARLPRRPSIFLQPHYDDAALSCGATAALLASQGVSCTIVTVFAGDVQETDLDEFASRKHARWNIGGIDSILYTRREEDTSAACVLGCALRWLDHPDAIYRDGLYGSDSRLYGLVHEREVGFPDALAEQLLQLSEVTDDAVVYVPLGIGNHVDHQLVFDAGCALAESGRLVYAYEDLPYTMHSPQRLQERLDTVASWTAEEIRHPIDAGFERKLKAIECYCSQLSTIFRFTPDWRASMRDHALSRGGHTPVERFWRVLPPGSHA